MPEHLTDLLRAEADAHAVPAPDTRLILEQGRGLHRRRRIIAGAALTAAVLAIGVGGVLVKDTLGEDRPNSQIAQHVEDDNGATPAPTSYDEWGAWVAGSKVTVGDRTVDVDHVMHLAQTSAGVVARQSSGDGWTYQLVRPDGDVEPLSIPTTVGHVDGDINAARVAWTTVEEDSLVLHVWDVDRDREVGTTAYPSTGNQPDNGQFVRQVRLDGDLAYFGPDNGPGLQVRWRTDDVTEAPYAPMSVHRGIATVVDGDESLVYDMVKRRVVRRLETGVQPTVSPDGRHVLVTDSDGGAAYVEPVDGGDRTELPGIDALMNAWTPGGSVISRSEAGDAVRRCTVGAACEEREVDDVDPDGTVLVADYLMVG